MKKIDVKRFNAFITFTRLPQAKNIFKEIEWYENYNSNVFATIILDRIDKDFSVVILRRDKDSKFRCSDTKYSLATIEEARKWMLDIVEKIEKSREYIFVQYDEKGKNIDVFNTIKNKNISDSFKILNNSDEYKPAKLLIFEIMPHYMDIDGNFVEQFQTTGFDARIWELYLYCYFNEEKFFINKDYSAPDFYISKDGYNISIEASTLNNKKENENISAILSSTSGTLNKFLRIGKQSGFDKYNKLCIMKEAFYYDPNPNASKPIHDISEVTEKTNEKWGDGLSIYHNPNAKFPIQRHLFPNATHHFFRNGLIETVTHPYSLLSSITYISIR
mgnify:CR=1 FL=1